MLSKNEMFCVVSLPCKYSNWHIVHLKDTACWAGQWTSASSTPCLTCMETAMYFCLISMACWSSSEAASTSASATPESGSAIRYWTVSNLRHATPLSQVLRNQSKNSDFKLQLYRRDTIIAEAQRSSFLPVIFQFF